MTYAKADGYKIRNQSGWHFLTFTIMGWIDILSCNKLHFLTLSGQ